MSTTFFFFNVLLCICVPCHQECTLHHFYERYYLAVPMQFSNAQSAGTSRRAQAVEAIGRETQAETNLTPGFQCFSSSLPGDMARKEDWQVGQEPGWDWKKAQPETRKLQVEDQKHQANFWVLFLLSLTAKFISLLCHYIAFVSWSQLFY